MLIPSIHERKSWLTFLLALVIGLNLYFNFSFKGDLEERSDWIDQFFGQALLPVHWLVSLSKNVVLDSSTNVSDLLQAQSLNEQYQVELREARLQLLELRRLKSENERLKALLNFRDERGRQFLAARVQAKDPSVFFQALVIDRGSRDGVKKDMAVVNLDGVVGRIYEVGHFRSTVLLITDLNSRVDAVIERSRSRVIVSGAPQRSLQLRFLPRRQDIRENDILLTSGLDGIFPAGFEIGQVTAISSAPNIVLDEAQVRPKVNIDSVEEVFVILPEDAQETQAPETAREF